MKAGNTANSSTEEEAGLWFWATPSIGWKSNPRTSNGNSKDPCLKTPRKQNMLCTCLVKGNSKHCSGFLVNFSFCRILLSEEVLDFFWRRGEIWFCCWDRNTHLGRDGLKQKSLHNLKVALTLLMLENLHSWKGNYLHYSNVLQFLLKLHRNHHEFLHDVK